MKVAMMQPTFLPWMGYFELMMKVDTFVLCDDFQFVSKSYHQNNRWFLNRNTVGLVSVPLQKKGNYQKNINEMLIREDTPWRKKLWRGIEGNYKKTEYFGAYAPALESVLMTQYGNLAEQNIAIIKHIAEVLGCRCRFLCSSELHSVGTRSERVKNLLEEIGAGTFYQAHGSFEYMYEDKVFPLKDVTIYFQNAEPEPYPQWGSTKGFVPYLSIIDALFNIGAERTAELAGRMTRHWLSWDEMTAALENKKSTDAA